MYQKLIAELGCNGHDPRHVEAFMRLQYGTLDHLSREQFAQEIVICVAAIEAGGVAEAEELAASMAL